MDSLFQAFLVNAFESDLSEMNSFTNWLGPSDPKHMGCPIMRLEQCSPYQAVTGTFYRLRWHLLPPAIAWKFTRIKLFVVLKNTQVVIQSDEFSQGYEWIYRKVSNKVYTTFLFMGYAFWKENIWDTGKIIVIKYFKLWSKDCIWFA